MGTNKAFLRRDGERLIDRTVRIYRNLFSEIVLVTNEPLLYLDQDLLIVTDLVRGKGPLMGIYTGLFYASSEYVFVAACDMPFLDEAFIRFLSEQATGLEDIVIPRSAGGLEPLHAVYSRRCMAPIRRLLDADRLKIAGFYKGMKQKIIEGEVLRAFDPEGRMFVNINRREDLQQADLS
jgi:molybdopterin-guanine dinucleotide biosynthesis protein A